MPEYNKLVRDKIPEIIKANGDTPITRILNDEEYLLELIKKISEEQKELASAATPILQMEELADLQELILAIAEHIGSLAQLEEIRVEKATKRGGFDSKVFLEGVE
jgi:predicted house-cleaning noncanonical NTP pyrophosphatase (MazG superfamily)